ncbi:hypothetical protein TIFTF001_018054 [Ficus carica]|uniref:Uncharacterized protein n=1 Tax=Ficus carica TaxID=3494 RepID=A0AA88DBA6_FICCA|nr:hypothetical protein TIFTF001_018054 [Ficus carica]
MPLAVRTSYLRGRRREMAVNSSKLWMGSLAVGVGAFSAVDGGGRGVVGRAGVPTSPLVS